MSNYISNETKVFNEQNPPWMNANNYWNKSGFKKTLDKQSKLLLSFQMQSSAMKTRKFDGIL